MLINVVDESLKFIDQFFLLRSLCSGREILLILNRWDIAHGKQFTILCVNSKHFSSTREWFNKTSAWIPLQFTLLQLANKYENWVRRKRERENEVEQGIFPTIHFIAAGIYLYKSSPMMALIHVKSNISNNTVCLALSIKRYLWMFSHYCDRSCTKIDAIYLCMGEHCCQVYKSVHELIAARPSVNQHSLF